jgi:hypothetical protein
MYDYLSGARGLRLCLLDLFFWFESSLQQQQQQKLVHNTTKDLGVCIVIGECLFWGA